MKLIMKGIVVTIILMLLSVWSIHGQTKLALLIGISEYTKDDAKTNDDSWSNIHGVNDVKLLTPTLKEQEFNITTLYNKEATATKIRKTLNKFASSCKEGDLVYIHFSCHGQPVEDLNGDEPEGWDEALVPIDAQKVYQKGVYEGKNHIIDDELNEYLREIRTKVGKNGFVYVVVDACHAGSSYRGDEEERITRGTNRGFTASNKPFVPKIDKRGKIEIEKSNVMSDICILEACRSYQVNSEIQENGIYYGSLSYYVNQVLQNIQLDNDIIWTNKVSRLMNEDIRLVRQNIVIETSL